MKTRSSAAKAVKGTSRIATAKSAVDEGAMDLISTGMHVDIKRSDGRVHTAVVTETRKDRNVVMVEWFEKNETKGKEIDLEQLLAINPTLRRRPQQPTFDTSTLLDNDENNETLDDIELPPRASTKFRAPVEPPKATNRRTTLLAEAPTHLLAAAPPVTARGIQPPTKKNMIAPPSQQKAALTSQSVASTPVAPITNPMVKSADRLDFNDTYAETKTQAVKRSTVQNIEKLQKERDERRAQQEQAKKAKEVEKAIDPGNPNYSFLLMIREYQSNIDYRPLKMTDAVVDSRISVCVRKRPMNKKEINKKDIEVVTIPNRDHLILHQPQVKVDLTKYLDNQKFRFDYTFDENTNNEMVYRFTAQPLVKTVFEQGFATCFAYGQTGSGKTHTMGGDFNGKNQNVSGGIYALTAADVFRLRNRDYKKHNLIVNCSFFEIYGAKVFDLLNGKQLLRVLEDAKKEVNVVGLKEETVENESEVLELIRKGTEMRTAGATSANSNSSRSHAVFQIVLKKNKKLWGKFSLIDLAGNERGQDTGNADHQTRMEGAEINKSLLALKECIRAMARNSNHIPFRTSKLTLVLRDSFIGENARTCMIAMISPGMSSCEHTLNTLRYADRVKELGADEGGAAAPMGDDELMLAKVNSDEEEDEEDLSLICSVNGTNQKEYERIKLASKINAAEEDVLTKQLEIPAILRSTAENLDKLIRRTSQADYDHEKYANDLLNTCNKVTNVINQINGKTEDWISLIHKEAELAKTNSSNNAKKK